jgi:hypothetical protein
MTQIDKEAVDRAWRQIASVIAVLSNADQDNAATMLMGAETTLRAALDAAEAEQKRLARMFHDATEQCIAAEAQNRNLGDMVHKRGNDLAEVRDKLKKAEAEKRLAVAAAYERAAVVVDRRKSILEVGTELSSRILALSDTDALAEYAEKVREEERERCAEIAFNYNTEGAGEIADAIREDK